MLDAAALLFAQRGVDAVSLRDIAAEADVHFALIRRYIGNRDELVLAVFDDLSDQLAQAVLDNPLSGQGFDADTVMGKWVRIAGALAIAGRPLAGRTRVQPGAGDGRDPHGRVRARRARRPACGRRRSSPRHSVGGSSRTTSIAAGELGDVPLDDAARRAGPLGAAAGRHAVAVSAGPRTPLALTDVLRLRDLRPLGSPRASTVDVYNAYIVGRRRPAGESSDDGGRVTSREEGS